MLRVALSRVRHQFGSLLLLSLAVAAAVAFLASAFTLGDAIRAAVYRETAAQAAHVAAHVTPIEALLTDADVRTLGELPGVEAVQPRMEFATVTLVRTDGRVVRLPGVPTLTAFVAPVIPDLTDHELLRGRFPAAPGELVVGQDVAEAQDWQPGARVTVLDTARGEHPFTITGVVEPNNDEGGVGLLPADYAAMLQTSDSRGWTALDVAGSVTPDAVGTALGGRASVISGAEYADELASNVLGGSITDIIRGLKLFSWVAVAVALAVAYNSFGIVLAQRRREVALVRCVGAGRGQVFRAVIVEAVLVGVLAAVLGYVAGQGLAMLAALGLGMVAGQAPDGLSVEFSAAAAVVALLVGVVVSVLAAVLPARAATRVAPVRALTDQGELVEDRRVGWLRAGVGTLLLAAGGGLAWYAAVEHDPWPGIGGGFLVMLALLALGPVVVGPLVRIVGWPGRLAGAAGHLAAANGARHPRRTAAVTNALTIGIGLVTVLLVGAASLQRTATEQLTGGYHADFRLSSVAPAADGSEYAPLPSGLADRLGRAPELADPVPIRERTVDRIVAPRGTLGVGIAAVDPDQLRAHLSQKFAVSGELEDFGTGSVVLTTAAAEELGDVRAGETVRVDGASLRVAAVVSGGFESPFGAMTVSTADFARLYGPGDPTGFLLWSQSGVDAAAARSAIDATVATLPDVDVDDIARGRAEITSTIDQLLAAGGLLVGMAILVAILGVMITLTLSVLERRREIAVLRALGLTRRQLYATLTLEGAIMALLAAVIGSVLGIALGIAGSYAAFGVDEDFLIAVPAGRILLVLVGAALVGVAAALPPARRASKTAPVAALAAA
ncbi:FtsX-like permease family protein [Cryptosporangium minutisporangium]|uniref:FtsX-like permease family protein n=1 Tax=Cryptosporangium minutisporangium TaxID=113569 RepID=A0ABP6T906_9ACTN